MADAALVLVADEIPASQAPQRAYGPQDHETAFHVWHGPSGRNLTRTAALTGYPVSTVHRWCHEQGWRERSDALREERESGAARSADAVVQQLIMAGQVPSIIAIHETIANPAHRDRLDAALAMLGLGGRVVPKQSFNINASISTDAEAAQQLQALDASELAALASAIRARRALPVETTPPPPPDPGRD